MYIYTTTSYAIGTFPSADISINKNRIKKYKNNSIYLNDGDSFEIELTNNTSNVYLVTIKLNNKFVYNTNNGIVLYPGEHVYLERYLHNNKKFMFKTYTVSENSKAVNEAIKNNGLVEIQFYKEYVIDNTTFWGPLWGSSIAYTNTSNTSDISRVSNVQSEFHNQITGRIAEGEKSNQTFIEANSHSFFTVPSHTVKYHIKPIDTLHISPRKIRTYCTECGRRVKRGWKYCVGCGTKVQ